MKQENKICQWAKKKKKEQDIFSKNQALIFYSLRYSCIIDIISTIMLF